MGDVDNIGIWWLEGFADDGDVYLCNLNLEKLNDLAEKRVMSLKRWLTQEGDTLSGLGKAICWTKEGQSFKVALEDKSKVAALKRDIAEEDGGDRIKTY